LKFNRKILFYLLFLVVIKLTAQELPPIQNYTPEEYGAENQNWAISQSSENYIYVANNSGLLEYNGAEWKLYNSPNNTIVRSVKVIGNKIYTGSYMEFGFWPRNKFGNLYYTSLIDKLKIPLIEDEQFWNIIEYDNWILFQSLNRIYIYNTIDESFSVINSKQPLTKAFKVGKSIYFQKMNEGVYKIENGQPILISSNPIVKNNILVNIYSVNKKIILQTQFKGFYALDNGSISKWDIKANKLISTSVYSSLQLKDGSFVIGTISNGVYHLDKKGKVLYQINQEKGLNNNTVLSMFEDQDHNLWLGLDNGISVVNLNSPFSVYNDTKGKLGTVYASAVFKNYLYIGTNQGLFYKELNSNNNFSFIKGTNGQVWSLNVYDDTLFCGHDKGTFVINNNKAIFISNVQGAWGIKPIVNHKNLLIQGNYNGLNILEKVNNKWQFRNKIEGFDISSKFFEFTKENEIFVSHEYKGVFKLELNKDYTKVIKYFTEKSAANGLKSSLVTYANKLWYTSKDGIFNYNNKQQKFIKDSLLTNNLFKNDVYFSGKLIADKTTNTLWGFTKRNLIYFSSGKLNNIPKANIISFSASFRTDVAGYESLTHLKDQTFLLGTSSGYVNLNLEKLKNEDYLVKINAIKKSILNDKKTSVSFKNDSIFKYKENNLYFNFSVPQYNKYTEVNYKFQLKGIYNNWSNWSTNSSISFKNLPYGDYTFNVKALVGNKLSTNTASFKFKIKRPFAISNLMLFVYTILFLLLIYLIHHLNKQYYKKQRQKLIEKKQRELALAELESEQKLMQIKNAQLNQEIESKNRELTISTMSIVKKNEILNKIKKELLVDNAGEVTKKAIKTIDKNISNKKDWEFLEKAFNNADKDFLKKVKTLHPELTPNDLRFCAYLRLNLSSKEIAPLVNISVRSVEIKRYRLRKKMNLPHEKSLVAYILSI
jgi:DNA-binding CsgD family transcriptional regulator